MVLGEIPSKLRQKTKEINMPVISWKGPKSKHLMGKIQDDSCIRKGDIQVKGTELKEARVRGRERREEVRRDEKGETFASGEEEGRSL